MVRAVYEQAGFVSGFSGDAITALFLHDKKQTKQDLYHRAFAAAYQIQQTMAALSKQVTPYWQTVPSKAVQALVSS